MRVILNWMRRWRWNAEHCIITNYWSQRRDPELGVKHEKCRIRILIFFSNPVFLFQTRFCLLRIIQHWDLRDKKKVKRVRGFVIPERGCHKCHMSDGASVTRVTWRVTLWCRWHLSLNIPVTTARERVRCDTHWQEERLTDEFVVFLKEMLRCGEVLHEKTVKN